MLDSNFRDYIRGIQCIPHLHLKISMFYMPHGNPLQEPHHQHHHGRYVRECHVPSPHSVWLDLLFHRLELPLQKFPAEFNLQMQQNSD